jgi:hypothetical protein
MQDFYRPNVQLSGSFAIKFNNLKTVKERRCLEGLLAKNVTKLLRYIRLRHHRATAVRQNRKSNLREMVVLTGITRSEFPLEIKLPISTFGTLFQLALSHRMYLKTFPPAIHLCNCLQVGSTMPLFVSKKSLNFSWVTRQLDLVT